MSNLQRFAVLGLLAVVGTTPNPGATAADCPTAVLFEPATTATTLDAGWTGVAHAQPLFGTTLHLGVSCAASTPPCGTCTITGVVANPAGHRQRCQNDTSIECTIATEVLDCGAANTCRHYLSPPQSVGIGGTPFPFCTTTEVTGAVTGSVNVETGSFAPTVSTRTTNYGFADPYQGCPRCAGDAVPNDTGRDGTCDAGPRVGLACDAHGISPLADFGSTSFDCPPSTIDQYLGADLGTLAFSTDPHSVTLTAASPKCLGMPFGSPTTPCFCSTCNDAAAEPCDANADCPPSGGNPGICGAKRCLGGSNAGAPCAQPSECAGGGLCGRPGAATTPNACLDDTINPDNPENCSPDVDGNGVCTAGPVDSYCTNHPNRGCGMDHDCDDVPGACTSRNRRCYLDNGILGGVVSVDGTATPPLAGISQPTDLGSLSCLSATGDSWTNGIWGLPGLARFHQSGRLVFGDAPAPGSTPTSSLTPTPTPAPGSTSTPSLTPTPTPAPTFAPCPTTPDLCRAPVTSQNASLQLTDRSPGEKDQLAWKWAAGAATTLAELGDPADGDDYVLCLYDGSGLRATMTVPAGGSCQGRPCWQPRSTGFVYRNKDATPHGLTQLTLKAGTDGKAQMHAKGKGALLPMPALASLTTTLQVQLRNKTSGLCWGATYSPPFQKATDTVLKDRAD